MRSWGEEGRPVVVLIHGLGLSAESWAPVAEALAARYRVVAHDLRGHGRSEPAASGDYGLAAQAADLAAVLDHTVPPPARAVAVGHSLGGAIILEHARAAGSPALGGAVFVGSGGAAVRFPGLPGTGFPRWARAWLRLGWLHVLSGAAALGRTIRTVRTVTNGVARLTVFGTDAPSAAVDRARQDFLTTDRTVLARTMFASVSSDGTKPPAPLAPPALVVHGDKDKEVSQDDIDRLMAAVPDAELVTIEGGDHMLPFTRPAVVAEQVDRWAARWAT